MTDNELLDLYSDDLISSCGPTTATGRATLFDQEISHDRGQRLVAGTKRRSSDLLEAVDFLLLRVKYAFVNAAGSSSVR